MHWIDWLIIAIYMVITLAVGLYFTRRAGTSTASYFVSERSMPWFLTGISMVATSFASDTPLWVGALVRQYGVYYVWQFWAPAIGAALALVLFARLWQRVGVLTDVEFNELRYSGVPAAWLRGVSGTLSAVLMCPLIIAWVVKAMEVIARECMGLRGEVEILGITMNSRTATTMLVVIIALVSCMFSGLWGVIWTDFFQFFLALIGTIFLAFVSVRAVGGLDSMLDKLHALDAWPGRELNISPSIGTGKNQMSLWNAIGYFGILWWQVALSGGYQAQRILACKDGKHATHAMLTNTIIYYGLLAWPWVIVALCSILLIPDSELLEGTMVKHDNAYPRMIVTLLGPGMRGMLVMALLAAFMSTVATLFNWGSSYVVNDIYQRFVVRKATPRHYVNVGRLVTLGIAVAGAFISFYADSIQSLLTIAFVIGPISVVLQALRWFWWRINAVGELAGMIVGWILAPLVLFARILDGRFGFPEQFSNSPDLLGARMMFMLTVVTLIGIVTSLVTRPTKVENLEEFVRRVRPFSLGWRPIIRRIPGYQPADSLGRMMVSWLIAVVCVYALLYGIGEILLGKPALGIGLLVVFVVTMIWTMKRIDRDFDKDSGAPMATGTTFDATAEARAGASAVRPATPGA